MKKSLTINAMRNGKKVAKSVGFVNPDAANSLVGGFAQMLNALSNDTFVSSQVVKTMDTTEEDSSGSSTPATTKLEPTLEPILDEYDLSDKGGYVGITYNGDGILLARTEVDDRGYTGVITNYFSEEYPVSPNTLVLQTEDYVSEYGITIYIHATEGERYAAKTISFVLDRND